jgi:hypothetical protein
MASPLPPQPGETAAQRKARFAAADRVQARVDAERRAEEAARIKKAQPKPVAPKATAAKPAPKAAPNPFADPNYALSQLNAYFGGLRKDYGEDAIRAAGFSPRDLSAMQASLRKLQMDPRATPEQHQQAFNQARDALAQRVTTPLAAARTPQLPAGAPRTQTPVTPANFDRNAALQQFNKNFADKRQKYGEEFFRSQGFTPRDLAALQSSLRNLQMDNSSTQSQHDAALSSAMDALNSRVAFPVEKMLPPVPSATDYIASIVTPPSPIDPSMMSPTMLGNTPPRPVAPPPMAGPVEPPLNIADDPSRGVIDNRIGPGFGKPMQPDVKPTLGDMMKGGIGSMLPPQMQPTPTMPSTAPGILPGIMQQQPTAPSMNTQPGADFDRNVGRQIFDAEFRTLREKYGDDGLRAAGLTPRTLASLQAPLTNVQRDNTISYDQSSAALENALKQLRGYNFGGAQPAAPMQPAAPAPLPAGAQQSPIPGYYRGGFAQRYR